MLEGLISRAVRDAAAGTGAVPKDPKDSPVIADLWGDGENRFVSFYLEGTRLEARIHLPEAKEETPEERAALERPRVVVSLVPAAEDDYTDVEVRQGDRIMVMAHVLKDGATSFATSVLHALGGRW